MSDSIKAYIRAASSVMNIMPSTDYLEYIAKTSDVEAIRCDVQRVALDMREVVANEFQNDEWITESKSA